MKNAIVGNLLGIALNLALGSSPFDNILSRIWYVSPSVHVAFREYLRFLHTVLLPSYVGLFLGILSLLFQW